MNDTIKQFVEGNSNWMGHNVDIDSTAVMVQDGHLRSALEVLLRTGKSSFEGSGGGFWRKTANLELKTADKYTEQQLTQSKYGFTGKFQDDKDFYDFKKSLPEDKLEKAQDLYSLFKINLDHYRNIIPVAMKKITAERKHYTPLMVWQEINQLLFNAVLSTPRPANAIYGWNQTLGDGSYGEVTVLVPESEGLEMTPSRTSGFFGADASGIGCEYFTRAKYEDGVLLPNVPTDKLLIIAPKSDLERLRAINPDLAYITKEDLTSDDLKMLNSDKTKDGISGAIGL
jgi:hypothetical protein